MISLAIVAIVLFAAVGSKVAILDLILAHSANLWQLFTAVGRRIAAWTFLFDGDNIIQSKFELSNKEPFEVLAPDNRYVFISSPKHIKELDTAPDTVLSLQAASKQMLQPLYTMHGFNWFNVRGTEGVGFVRALRTLLTNNLPQILPNLGRITLSRFEEMRLTHPVVNGEYQTPVYPTILSLVVLLNAVSFFGSDLAKYDDFMHAGLAYIEETLICAELIRLTPDFLAPLLGTIMQRCAERDLAALGHSVPKHVRPPPRSRVFNANSRTFKADCIQWIMETSPKQRPWSPERIVHELMAIWFGSVHALSTARHIQTITFEIHDLSLYPEHVEPIRKELESQYGNFERTVSTRRSALIPFTLSDGTKLNVGDWACTPVKSIMQDPEFYPEPLRFNGFRFADPQLVPQLLAENYPMQPKPTRLCDVDNTFHVWGTGRMACPGRYYAAAAMKVILGKVIMNYDCELLRPDEPRWLRWRSTTLPKQSTKAIFTPRKPELL
ncbi:unnamed protein product, partial [Clonostachys rhizophaga]